MDADAEEFIYQKLYTILGSCVIELDMLRQFCPAGPMRGNISDYLHTFVILRRSAKALRNVESINENT